VVTAFAAANGTGFSTPSGTTERYDAQSGGAVGTRASLASHSYVQATAGPTGAKTSTLVSSRWLAHLLSFAVDDAAPSVAIADPGTYLRGTVTLEATATDPDSGVARVQFQRAVAGSGTWVNVGPAVTAAPYRASFDTRGVADGLYDLRAVATDNAANTAAAVAGAERVDNGVPTVASVFPIASGSYNLDGWSSGCSPAGLCGSAGDAGSGIQSVQASLRRSTGGLYWDGSSFASTTETFTPAVVAGGTWSFPFSAASFPANGSYVLRARAIDAAGNVTTAASRTFTFDTAPPNTSITASQPGSTNNPAPTFSFSSSEGGSTFACRLDGGAFEPCLSPTTFPPLADGVHTFEVRATDRAGNTDGTPAAATWRIDTVAPAASVTNPVAGSTVSSTIAATATAADAVGVAGVQFLLDGAPLGGEDRTAPYTASWNTRLVAGGPHAIAVVARDAAGNRTTATAPVIVDNNGVPGPNLLAAYGFDEGLGTLAADASGNGRTGTLVGAGWTEGRFGSAVFLDGIDDRVDLPALGTFYRTAFTFEAWVLKRGTRNDVAVVGTWDGDGPMIWTHHVSGRYMLTLGNGEYLDSGRLPIVGQWQHLGATYDGAVARFYVDGAEVASRPFTGDGSTSNVWRIGAFRAVPTGHFDGLIDEVRVYSRALPAAELNADMTTSVAPTDDSAPSTPTQLEQAGATETTVDLRWTASTDNVRVTGYRVYRDGVLAASVTDPSARLTGLSCGTWAVAAVEAVDGAGNASARASLPVTTAPCDGQPPTIELTSPVAGSTLNGTVVVAAAAADDVGITGVTFSIDGTELGTADTTPPYSASWNTRLVTNGAHQVRAVAHDPSGNVAAAEALVTVDNAGAPAAGLVAGYGFDAGEGTVAVDGSGNVHTATLVGAGWAVGRHGWAVSLDGADDRVELPALGPFYRTGFTIEAWVSKSGPRRDVAVVGSWDPGAGGPMIWIDHIQGHYMLTLGGAFSDYLDSGVSPAVGVWQHVAATFDGTVARFFVDGVEVASRSFAGDVGTSDAWRVGAYRTSPTGFFDGLIDDVRIYERALLPAEIQADLTTPASSDVSPPTIEAASPEAGAVGVATTTSVRVVFSEAMDATTIDGDAVALRDGAGSVGATVVYDQSTQAVTLTPTSVLAPDRRYTVTVAGGLDGVADAAGNRLRADESWSFTTRSAPPPILVLSSAANRFGAYVGEILEAEGLESFDSLDISQLSSSLLAGYDVVVLGETPVTPAQAALLATWTENGGNLVALRPDKRLAGLLGLTDAGGTRANGYLRVDTTAEPGAGIVGETMQFHGSADLYTLAGARAVATLYADAATATSSPAVTIRDVGTSGGQAAAFTYDLARSVVYTRQGNPAWAGQERDGIAGVRPNDLFYGAAAGDPQPDWLDTTKIAIPQADEQQRLLVNLITLMARDRIALPRFWYFPHDLRAAVVMTEDDHGDGGSIGRFDQHIAASPPGCSVADWECVRSTSYMYASSPMTDAQAKAYEDAGFEVALHVAASNGCGEWTYSGAYAAFSAQRLVFGAKYPSVTPSRTNRSHCVTWNDWATEPLVELAHGVRLDTNYYAYPASWIADKPGFMTGSGIPMPFADVDGSLIDVYQATTQLNDEAGQAYPFSLDALLDRALGSEGYYGYFVANAHADRALSAESDAILQSAQAHGVPVISAAQLLDWLLARDASRFESIGWSDDTMRFEIAADAKANGLRALLPLAARGGGLNALTRDGAAVPYSTRTIKGVAYAVFPGVSGTYAAVYG
jgi:hypothetical protein